MLQVREKLWHPFYVPATPHHELVLAECVQLQCELAGDAPWDMGQLLITKGNLEDTEEGSNAEETAGS